MPAKDILAIDIGGTKVAWGWINADMEIVRPSYMEMRVKDVTPMEHMANLVNLFHHMKSLARIGGVAIASAGVVDPQTGKIVSATDVIPGWSGLELGELTADLFKVPVHIINDVHAHGLGEAVMGAGRGYGSVLSMALGTGIGGAMIRDGEIDFGQRFLAGHFGHVVHPYATDVPCSCGRTGHIEAIGSGSGITQWYNMRLQAQGGADDDRAENGKHLQELADGGNQLAQQVFVDSGYAVGQALASLSNAMDPGAIVLSGSMTRSGERWWDSLRSGYASSAMDLAADMPILLGELGSQAPLYGALINFQRKQA